MYFTTDHQKKGINYRLNYIDICFALCKRVYFNLNAKNLPTAIARIPGLPLSSYQLNNSGIL